MSDGNRQRPAIDLDDLERQLRAVAQPKAARSLPPEPQAPTSPPPFMVKPVFSASLPENESFTPAEPEAPVASEPSVAAPMPPVAPKPASRPADYDPLAELARIAQSGSDWSAPRTTADASAAPPARSTAAIDALEALLRMDPPQKPPVPSYPAVTPRMTEAAPPSEPVERSLLDYAEPPQAEPVPSSYPSAYPEAPLYPQVAAAEAEPIYAPEGQLPPHDAGFVAEEPPPRSRGGLKLAAALVGVAALGVGGVFLFRGDGVSVGGGPRTPPVIKASNEPTKVAPQNPGGMEVPNSNQEIFAGSKAVKGPPAPSKVVSSEEQPVDVNQAAKPSQPRVILPNGGSAATVPPAPPPPVSTVPRDAKGTAATANTNPPQAAPQPPAGSGVAALGEPKKVRTVLVRPDGTVIDGTEPAKPPAMAAAPSVTPASPVPTQTLPGVAAAPPPGGAPPPAIVLPSAPPAPTPTQTASAAPAATAPTAPAPDAQTAATPAPAGTPLPPRRPAMAAAPAAPAAEPQQAAAAPVRPAPATPAAAPAQAAPVQTASVGTGDFAVQLAAPPTEQEAKTLASRLAQRYGETLAGQEPEIIRAEVNGKVLYRVRITGLDRESANTMCNRIKSAQGSCFVAKN